MTMTTTTRRPLILKAKWRMHKLVEMLAFCRPQASLTQSEFCDKYLRPVFNQPDKEGNYILVIGKAPKVCFASHHDTVHKADGIQDILVKGDTISLPPLSDSSCLGADCTTGIWLQLEMIRAGVEGVYVVHASEELGCLGSRYVVDRSPRWLQRLDAVISFDRKGTESIITHQMGLRTASDAFAISLASILGLPLRPDDTGSYTDSNEYASDVSECTNLSVGYYAQHTKGEHQDVFYLQQLRDALIAADWSKLVIARDPSISEYKYEQGGYASDWVAGNRRIASNAFFDDPYLSNVSNSERDERDDITDLLREYPAQVADWLDSNNITYDDLIQELDITDIKLGGRTYW